jgi:HK97 family phage major capsid protein
MKNYIKSMSPLHIALTLIGLVAATLLVMHGMHAEAFGLMTAPAAAATIEELAVEMKSALKGVNDTRDELKSQYAELAERLTKGEQIPASLKESIDKCLTGFNGIKEEFAGLEQKMVAARDAGPQREKSWGEQFMEGKAGKTLAEQGSQFQGTTRSEVKQVNSTAAGGLIRSYRENDVVNLLRERRVVRDLLRTVPVNTSSVDYVTQTTRTNAAAPVAEAASKPYSDYAWGSATVVIRTLAHLTKITRQAMDDAPRLIAEIDGEMRYGLGFVEERQFLYGTGVGQNLLGIMPQATAFAVPAGFPVRASATKIDVLRVAMLQNAIAMLPADGIVLHDIDWADIELTKTTDGAYLFANPQGSVSPRMWGLPVVNTPAMVAGDFLVGNFALGATVYDRMGVEVLISTENADDFETNRATMRAEERVGIAVKRPQAFTKGTFSTAITDITS